MSRIALGRNASGPVEVDVDELLMTRVLITANSGGGKSYLLRVLLELLRPHVQEIVIDAEDEFSSLQEKYEYAKIGEGGLAAMDVRSAGLLAERLLEHRISAICNLYELKAHQRPVWVKNFTEALMNAQKKFWHHVLIAIDETQMFAPENGKAESFNGVVDLATRGRKRGFCLVAAVQRLADLSKKVSAQLLNRLVGQTFEDLDLDRAMAVLSVGKEDQRAMRDELKILEPGNFYGLGRAISKTRILFKVRAAKTSHPEPGKITKTAVPELPPDKLKDLLSKLGDLPKAAEDKVKNEAELRAENRALRAELAKAKTTVVRVPVPAPPSAASVVAPKRVEVPVILKDDLRRLEAAASRMEKAASVLVSAQTIKDELRTISTSLTAKVTAAAKGMEHLASVPPRTALPTILTKPAPVVPRPRIQRVPDLPAEDADADGALSGPQYKILRVVGFFHQMGISDVPRTWVAPLADTSHTSGGYGNNLGRLRTLGYLDYRRANTMCLTPRGDAAAGPQEMLSAEEIFRRCENAVTGPQVLILKFLHSCFPGDISRDELAAGVNVPPTSGGYGNNLGALRSAGMIMYTSPGRVRLESWVAGELKESSALAI